MQALWRRWEDYWFRPAPVVTLAVCRIIIVGVQLFLLLVPTPGRPAWRIVFADKAAVQASLYHPLTFLRLLTLPWNGLRSFINGPWAYIPSFQTMMLCHAATVCAGIFALVGLFTRVSLGLFAIGNMTVVAYIYSFGDFHHVDAIMMIALMALTLAPSGEALSLDDLRHRYRLLARDQRFVSRPLLAQRSAFALWPLLLIQWIYALVYLSAAFAKLRHSGVAWFSGQTLQFYLTEDGLRWNRPFGAWLGQRHRLTQILAAFTIFFEGTFFAAVIVPSLAWMYILMGVGFHLGIYFAMEAAFWEMMAVYCVFVPWDRVIEKVLAVWRSRGWATPCEVVYDGLCPLCTHCMTTLQAMDVFGLLTFSDLETEWPRVGRLSGHLQEPYRQEMHVLLDDGLIRSGFSAWREISKRLPVLWPLVPVLYLPVSSSLGPQVYRWIARHRVRLHACRAGACRVTTV